jgi:exonuclease III
MNFGNLSLLCWNVRGLGDPAKCFVAKDTIRASCASIFCIQEMKLNEISFAKFHSFAPAKYIEYAALPSTGSRGGTLTAWTSDYTLNTSYTLTFSTTVILTNNLGFTLMVTNTYGPTSNTFKHELITELRMIACLHDLPWLLLGDFNIIRDTSEYTSTNPKRFAWHNSTIW